MPTPHHARRRQIGVAAHASPNATSDGDWPSWFDAFLAPAIAPLLAVGLERGVLDPAGAQDAGIDGERR